jgi:polyphosphate glucokinase
MAQATTKPAKKNGTAKKTGAAEKAAPEKPSSNGDQPEGAEPKAIRTLAVDIGGTGIKMVLLNELGRPISDRIRVRTPQDATPGAVLDAIADLAKKLKGEFDRVSVGFPGVVRKGIVLAAPKLGKEWRDFNIGKLLGAKFSKPVRVANDADVQGFGCISGVGVELVLTLGTGVGTALFVDGRLVPNVEAGKDKLSNAELARVGKRRWNRRLAKLVEKLQRTFHFDRLYIGGGNAKLAALADLPPNVTIVSNLNGLVGGIALWRDEHPSDITGNAQPETGLENAKLEGEPKEK